MSSSSLFDLAFSFQGKTVVLANVTTENTGQYIEQQARVAFGLDETVSLKLLCKGKVLAPDDTAAFQEIPPKNWRKILVMASSQDAVKQLNAKRSDATIRGFDQVVKNAVQKYEPWGPTLSRQNQNYKFCRFQACTWQSFGHRAVDTKTPHAFAAMQLLEKLATDPGVVAVLVERELVVGTLGEMDPIDDRLKQKLDAKGSCLLGYNTNHGLRIDVKLRPDSLEGFLPYPQIVSTLIHELSHNWVSEHDLLFWSNLGQMRVEYLHKHAAMAASGMLVNGKTTSQLAGVSVTSMKGIAEVVLAELQHEMAQHGLHHQLIAPAIVERYKELAAEYEQSEQGLRVGSGRSMTTGNPKERMLAAAERRARQQRNEEEANERKDA